MKKIIILASAIIAAIALTFPAAANTYPYFDWAWGYGYEREFHQNRWYSSSTVMQREQAYVRLQLDKCLPKEARLRLRYVSTSGWAHGETASAFGACSVHNYNRSNGASYVEFRIEYWNCTEGWGLGSDCGTRTTPQGDCYYNIYPWQGCPGGYKWYRLHEAWAYSNIGGCLPACQRQPASSPNKVKWE